MSAIQLYIVFLWWPTNDSWWRWCSGDKQFHYFQNKIHERNRGTSLVGIDFECVVPFVRRSINLNIMQLLVHSLHSSHMLVIYLYSNWLVNCWIRWNWFHHRLESRTSPSSSGVLSPTNINAGSSLYYQSLSLSSPSSIPIWSSLSSLSLVTMSTIPSMFP